MDKETIRKVFSSNLNRLLEDRGLSQNEFSSRLGWSRQKVGNWSRAEGMPGYDSLLEMADFFGVRADDLLRHQAPEEIDVPLAIHSLGVAYESLKQALAILRPGEAALSEVHPGRYSSKRSAATRVGDGTSDNLA